MLRWMSGTTIKARIRNTHIIDNLRIAPFEDKLRE